MISSRALVFDSTGQMPAAAFARLATGFWKNRDQTHRAWQIDRTFEPRMAPAQAAHRRQRWTEALTRARGWEEPSATKSHVPR
jgi:glycerol kinase